MRHYYLHVFLYLVKPLQLPLPRPGGPSASLLVSASLYIRNIMRSNKRSACLFLISSGYRSIYVLYNLFLQYMALSAHGVEDK